MSTVGKVTSMTDGVESLLDDGGAASERVLMYVEDLVDADEIQYETWFEMLAETDTAAIRLGGNGAYAWYVYSMKDGTVTVTRRDQDTSTTHDIDGEYMRSMIDHYDLTIVRKSNVGCIDVDE